jgi:hypothetical protein
MAVWSVRSVQMIRCGLAMRVVLFISFLLAVGGVADAVFFDSTYRAAVIDEAGYQGQIFIYKVDSFIRSISP